MIVLGLSAYYHDSAAVLVRDGEIVAAAEEERFSRKKQDSDFPAQALAYCLSEAGIGIGEVDHVVFYDKPWLKFERLMETHLAVAPRGLGSFLRSMPVWISEKLFMRALLTRELKRVCGEAPRRPVLFSEHHLSHAASAFYPSPFERAAILTLDGVGEWAT
ncbi:MAG: carbamoyltransferase N-terminal domain-containing protein, partial [Bdellovibrionota bacterium]